MRRKKPLLFILLLSLLFISCEKEEPQINDPNAPEINLMTARISTAPGDIFLIEAVIKDDVGIKTINLQKTDWYLDKDIVLTDSIRKEYNLRYKFLTPANAEAIPHTLIVSVEDLGGNITSVDVQVTLDKDVEAPQFNITSPTNGSRIMADNKVSFFIEVTDNIGIDTFYISAPIFGLDSTITFDPVNSRYIYVNDFWVPNPIADGEYYINIFASDSTGNTTAEIIALTAGEVQTDEIYIVGGATWSGWDDPSASNPMLMKQDAENEGWYEIITYSYGVQDQNGVKFIGQRGWGPNNWGLDPSDPTKMVNDDGSDKIILAEEGYWKVRFNPSLLEYTIEKADPAIGQQSEMYILGSGMAGMDNGWLNPSAAISMTQDAGNPYIYTATVEFTATGSDDWGATFIFIGDKNDVSAFNLGFNYYPEAAIDPNWTDYPGYVVGDLSLNLDPLTVDQLSGITTWPPEGNWNGVPYIAYYEQAGTYEIRLDYYIRHASITKISE
jgi:hypothetical protein